MEDVDLYEDVYGDLEAFDAGEKLKEVTDKVAQLTASLEAATEKNKLLRAKNKQQSAEIKVLTTNHASLLLTARNEIRRKDNEIQRLRKEKDDLCLRRNIHAKPSPPSLPPKTAAIVHNNTQTEITFGTLDTVDVFRRGQTNLVIDVEVSTARQPADQQHPVPIDNHINQHVAGHRNEGHRRPNTSTATDMDDDRPSTIPNREHQQRSDDGHHRRPFATQMPGRSSNDRRKCMPDRFERDYRRDSRPTDGSTGSSRRHRPADDDRNDADCRDRGAKRLHADAAETDATTSFSKRPRCDGRNGDVAADSRTNRELSNEHDAKLSDLKANKKTTGVSNSVASGKDTSKPMANKTTTTRDPKTDVKPRNMLPTEKPNVVTSATDTMKPMTKKTMPSDPKTDAKTSKMMPPEKPNDETKQSEPIARKTTQSDPPNKSQIEHKSIAGKILPTDTTNVPTITTKSKPHTTTPVDQSKSNPQTTHKTAVSASKPPDEPAKSATVQKAQPQTKRITAESEIKTKKPKSHVKQNTAESEPKMPHKPNDPNNDQSDGLAIAPASRPEKCKVQHRNDIEFLASIKQKFQHSLQPNSALNSAQAPTPEPAQPLPAVATVANRVNNDELSAFRSALRLIDSEALRSESRMQAHTQATDTIAPPATETHPLPPEQRVQSSSPIGNRERHQRTHSQRSHKSGRRSHDDDRHITEVWHVANDHGLSKTIAKSKSPDATGQDAESATDTCFNHDILPQRPGEVSPSVETLDRHPVAASNATPAPPHQPTQQPLPPPPPIVAAAPAPSMPPIAVPHSNAANTTPSSCSTASTTPLQIVDDAVEPIELKRSPASAPPSPQPPPSSPSAFPAYEQYPAASLPPMPQTPAPPPPPPASPPQSPPPPPSQLLDEHHELSMDVDYDLNAITHDPQRQSADILSLFDALETPRKTLRQLTFAPIADCGSLISVVEKAPTPQTDTHIASSPPTKTTLMTLQANGDNSCYNVRPPSPAQQTVPLQPPTRAALSDQSFMREMLSTEPATHTSSDDDVDVSPIRRPPPSAGPSSPDMFDDFTDTHNANHHSTLNNNVHNNGDLRDLSSLSVFCAPLAVVPKSQTVPTAPPTDEHVCDLLDTLGRTPQHFDIDMAAAERLQSPCGHIGEDVLLELEMRLDDGEPPPAEAEETLSTSAQQQQRLVHETSRMSYTVNDDDEENVVIVVTRKRRRRSKKNADP